MIPEQVAAATRRAVDELGDGFGTDPHTLRRARQLGLTGWAFQVAGRGGALGDVDAATVSAALGFLAPDAVREGWTAARRVISPAQAARCWLIECCRWGHSRLEQFYALPPLVALAQRVVDGVAATAGLPLFSAWRAVPVPASSLGARAAALCHLLREYQEGTLLLAVRARGMSPLQALLARSHPGRPGPVLSGVYAPVDGATAAARAGGWAPPYPYPAPLRRRWPAVRTLADRMVGAAYEVLDPGERAELVGLLTEAAELVRAPAPTPV